MIRRLPLAGKIGLGMVLVVVAVAAISLVWTPADPLFAAPAERLAGPSPEHWLGTDRFGRDTASRIMVGAQITVLVALAAVALSAFVGVPLGIVAAQRGGAPGATIMRGADLLLAFPALLLAIMFSAVWGASTWTSIIAIGIAGIPGFIRVARAGSLQVLGTNYVAAARLSGKSSGWIARKHVVLNIAPVLIVQVTVGLSMAILAEAGLSFLGVGTPPPYASWGRMLQSAQASLGSNPQLAVWPGLAIAWAVLGCTLLGDGLRTALHPTERKPRP
ncbi:putative oligopeptide ABC transport system membrane protein [Corynebacterium renale]|uniref:ABC transporter permease n=1 Tax=Corynebacterium renale TaxID=1724 RepID=UPI000DA358D3|nr:ABC transporter permease [Corynebacterium renale]SQG65138.1 putative oligopeptide ABC transport system membrane protein [Corynebacterium renale]STC98025.1 putative oligopeptide ABC transport system membrane protein [Corynebacterium renale]